MKELACRVWKKEEGFSLIELIIVIAILAIIAAIAIPNLVENLNNSREGVDKASGKIIADAILQEIALKEYDAAAIAGFDEDTANPGIHLDFEGTLSSFEQNIDDKINNNLPSVKRFSSGEFEANIVFSSTGEDVTIYVYVDKDGGTDHPTTDQVYPNPSGVYND